MSNIKDIANDFFEFKLKFNKCLKELVWNVFEDIKDLKIIKIEYNSSRNKYKQITYNFKCTLEFSTNKTIEILFNSKSQYNHCTKELITLFDFIKEYKCLLPMYKDTALTFSYDALLNNR